MTDIKLETKITIGLILLLLLCLFKLPYGVYMLIRFILAIGFGILAYSANEEKLEKLVIFYIILAVLFQPIFKIPLGRTIWNIVDVVISVSLVYILLKKNNQIIN